jgi:hypothetical protein
VKVFAVILNAAFLDQGIGHEYKLPYRSEEGAGLSLVSLARLIAQIEFDAAMYPASSRARHDR